MHQPTSKNTAEGAINCPPTNTYPNDVPLTHTKRTAFRALCAALFLGGWLLLLLRLSPSPDLLHKASRTGFSGDTPYQWLSNHELLVFDRASVVSWTPAHFDITTNVKTPLTALQRCLSDTIDLPFFLKVSPNGKQAAIQDTTGIHVITLENGLQYSWNWSHLRKAGYEADCALYWLEDNPRLCLLPNLTTPDSSNKRPLILTPLNPQFSTLNLPTASLPPEFAATSYYSPPLLTPTGLLYAYASAYEDNDTRTLLTLSLRPGSTPAKHVFHAPHGLTFAVFHNSWEAPGNVSPQGTRVFWLCHSQVYTPPLQGWLHWLFPAIHAPACQWTGLYVSDVEGTAMREIGGMVVETASGAGGRDEDEIQDIRWLPDGEHLSFCLRHALYTVGVTP